MHRSTFGLTFARLLGPVVSVYLLALLARSRGPGEMGIYGIGIAAFALLEAVVSLGFRSLIPRELSKRRDIDLLQTAALMNMSVGIVFAIVLSVISLLFVAAPLGIILILVAGALPITGLLVSWESSWFAEQKIGRLVFSLIFEQVIRGILGVIVLGKGHGALALMTCFLIGRGLAVIAAWPPDVRLNRLHMGRLRELIHQIPVFLGLEACFQLYWRVDVLLLGIMKVRSEVGFYVAAYRIFSALLLLPQSYGQLLLPRLAARSRENVLKRGYRDLAIIGAILSVGVFLLRDAGIGLLYGEGFEQSSRLLFILGCGLIPASIDQAQGRTLVARGAQLWDLMALAWATVSNITLNLMLIPQFGAEGAAWATLASLLVSLGVHRRALGKYSES